MKMRVRISEFGTRFFSKWNVDYSQLRSILGVKTLMSGRSNSLGQIDNRRKNLTSSILQFSLFFVFGLIASFGLLFDSVLSGMTFSYTIIMTALGLTFINHFTTALLDTTENQILLPRPVSGRTLLIARVIYTGYYMSYLALSCGLATMLAVGYKHGIYPLMLFLITLVLIIFLLNTVTQMICVFAINFINTKKIHIIIFYCIILFALIFLFSLGDFIRILTDDSKFADFKLISIEGAWMNFYPPSWMAGLMSAYIEQPDESTIVLSLLALIIPTGGLFLSMTFLGKRFNKMLSNLETVPKKKVKNVISSGRKRWAKFLNIVEPDATTKAIFTLTTKLMQTDLSFKLRTYPTFFMLAAFVLSSNLFVGGDSFKSDQPFESIEFFLVIYLGSSFMSSMLTNIQYSDQYKAAWIFKVLPIVNPGDVLSATLKAYMWRFILPMNVLVIGSSFARWGWETLLDTLYASVVGVLLCILQCRKLKLALVAPFSRNYSVKKSSANTNIQTFLILFQILLMAGVHALLKFNLTNVGVIVGCIITVIVTAASYRSLKRLDWEYLEIESLSR